MTAILYDLAGRDDRRFSPFCWRARFALAHKGVDFQTEPVGFTEKAKIEFSGQTRVPILRHDGKIVPDSWAIACYLEERYPDRPSLFDGEAGKSLAHFFSRWTDMVQIQLVPNFIKDIYDHTRAEDQPYFRDSREKFFGAALETLQSTRTDEKLAAWRQSLDPVRTALGDAPFIAGSTPRYADYILMGTFQWVRSVSPLRLIEESDTIEAWRLRMLDLHDGLARETVAYTY